MKWTIAKKLFLMGVGVVITLAVIEGSLIRRICLFKGSPS